MMASALVQQRTLRVWPLAVALGLVVAAGGYVGFARDSSGCVLPPTLQRVEPAPDTDKRQLTRQELGAIQSVAAHYREAVRAIPGASDSKAARESLASRPDRAYAYCQAILTEQILRGPHRAPDQSSWQMGELAN